MYNWSGHQRVYRPNTVKFGNSENTSFEGEGNLVKNQISILCSLEQKQLWWTLSQPNDSCTSLIYLMVK